MYLISREIKIDEQTNIFFLIFSLNISITVNFIFIFLTNSMSQQYMKFCYCIVE